MKTIALTQGRVTLVDDADWEWLSRWKWSLWTFKKRPYIAYAYRKRQAADGSGLQNIWMHRVILNVPPGIEGDHINGDGLDNRRANLRPATPSLNHRNSHRRSPTRLGLPQGVRKSGNKYVGQIGKSPRRSLGTFDSAKQAHTAYLEAQVATIAEAETAMLSLEK